MYTSVARAPVGCCGGFGQLGAEQVAPKQYFDFTEKTIAGTTVRIIDNPSQKSWFKVTFVGWEIYEPPSGPLIGGTLTIVHQPPDATHVRAKSAIQHSAKEVGNLFRWVEGHLDQGRGVVVVPPPTWQNGDDLLRWETRDQPGWPVPKPGDVIAIATNSIVEAATIASPGSHGFVLYEPEGGWVEEGGVAIVPGPPGKIANGNGGDNTGLYVGLGIGILVVGGLLAASAK